MDAAVAKLLAARPLAAAQAGRLALFPAYAGMIPWHTELNFDPGPFPCTRG